MNLSLSFTALIPVYYKDDAQLFDQALVSIKSNTIPPDQIVIVIDGPVGQNLLDVVAKYENPNVTVIKLEKNEGIISALNTGLLHCNYDLVARCDSDDINATDRFEQQLKAFSVYPSLSVCGGQTIEVSETEILRKIVPTSEQDIGLYLKFRNPMNHMTVMFNKSHVKEVGSYPDIKFREDYGLWCKLLSSGRHIINLPSVLVTVSGGQAMYKRRGKPSDILFELKLQKLLYQSGLINRLELLRNIVIRGGNMILPPLLRGFAYKLFFRKSI